MVAPKRLTRKCTKCRDGMMDGELQTIPNEIPLSSFQKIVPADYMPEIMKIHLPCIALFILGSRDNI
jgi:hypothetical protein